MSERFETKRCMKSLYKYSFFPFFPFLWGGGTPLAINWRCVTLQCNHYIIPDDLHALVFTSNSACRGRNIRRLPKASHCIRWYPFELLSHIGNIMLLLMMMMKMMMMSILLQAVLIRSRMPSVITRWAHKTVPLRCVFYSRCKNSNCDCPKTLHVCLKIHLQITVV